MKYIVTGGAGFIGSALVRHLISNNHSVFNIDKLTYAADLNNLRTVINHQNYSFLKADICDKLAMLEVFHDYKPDGIFHLAAESHVDRSIDQPQSFIDTNILGTANLLSVAHDYWINIKSTTTDSFRFLHVSTDEVFGSLGKKGLFTEKSPYQPRSPYSASKAASDHLVRSWHHTYGLPVIITNCSNNYGPYQFPEKLIPTVIKSALLGHQIPVYGKGENVRDWLYVDDHVSALMLVIEKGKIGETYNIGDCNEMKNIDLVNEICIRLNKLCPRVDGVSYSNQIQFVEDRPGHDFRYAIDSRKICKTLKWQPLETFTSGLDKTINWYIANQNWWNGDGRQKATSRLGLNYIKAH